jgi:hypothetical protein
MRTLELRDPEISSLLQENINFINRYERNIQQMVMTLETKMDNDHSPNGVMGSSRPIARSTELTHRDNMELHQDTRNYHIQPTSTANNLSTGVLGSS